jgi:hypothetical protein
MQRQMMASIYLTNYLIQAKEDMFFKPSAPNEPTQRRMMASVYSTNISSKIERVGFRNLQHQMNRRSMP